MPSSHKAWGRWQRLAHRVEGKVRNVLAQRFSRPRPLDPPGRVVFVCQGNICRSVFAEHLYRRLQPDAEVASAGVLVSVANPPPGLAVAAARRFGLDISSHRSRSIEALADTPATVYFALEPWQARSRWLRRARREGRVHLLGAWSSPPRAAISDPYGSDEQGYRLCFETVERALEGLRSRMRRCS